MSDKLYYFIVTYKDKANGGGIGSKHNIIARNVMEAKNIFKSRHHQYSIVSCVRGKSCEEIDKQGAKELSKGIGSLLGGLALAAGAAVVATVMSKDKK